MNKDPDVWLKTNLLEKERKNKKGYPIKDLKD